MVSTLRKTALALALAAYRHLYFPKQFWDVEAVKYARENGRCGGDCDADASESLLAPLPRLARTSPKLELRT